MSIFGKLDAQNIPTNPFFVEKGEYSGEVTKAEFRNLKDGGRRLYLEYTINDENSQYFDSKAPHFFDLVDSEMTEEAFTLLPAEEQKKIRRNLSNLKRTLCGNDANEKQKGLGVNPDDLNDPNWDPAILLGTKINFAIVNYGPTNEGVAVRWVNLAE